MNIGQIISDQLFAHSRPQHSEDTWEPPQKHLKEVADLAANFASAFGGDDAARIAGLLHNLGKAKPEFQAYLRGMRGSEPHTGAGARLCIERYGEHVGKVLAFCIAGHRAGLPTCFGGAVRPARRGADRWRRSARAARLSSAP